MDAVIISTLNVFDGKNFVGTKDVAIEKNLRISITFPGFGSKATKYEGTCIICV